ncbi:hypothetical protein AOC05_07710 [Arthrobacter alpinus]|uniref:Uncharacterized protein n=1 Tax=Arthrobacter alpinus TaxID=656366 RepID=A0A0M3UG06_9MICC|nr:MULTISPECIES: hypothetical protein [Arthrobacter]ALE92245.1 hypothetical protein AOC05_07710 [Arthrobacter alpinus]
MTQTFTGLLAYPITFVTHDGEPKLGALTGLVRNAAAAGVSAVTVLATSGQGSPSTGVSGIPSWKRQLKLPGPVKRVDYGCRSMQR